MKKKAFHGLISIYFDGHLVKQYVRPCYAKKFVGSLPASEKIKIRFFSEDVLSWEGSIKEFLKLEL